MSFDVWIENRTPFVAETHLQPDVAGQEVFVALFSATFQAEHLQAPLEPAPEQLPIAFADVPYRGPAPSSNRYESDIAPAKPMSDIIVNGSAYAPGGKPIREIQVGLKIGQTRKVLNVCGDRLYDAGSYSAPHPFLTMPIVYERAFGGTTPEGKMDVRNPVGVGFHHARSADPDVRTDAPNVTYPEEHFRGPSDRPRPAGFGALGRSWQPRLPLAGTYDQAWIDTQWPLPPKDFDPKYHLCAPPDQRVAALAGGERVSIVNMTPNGRWDFALPSVVAPIRLLYSDRVEDHAFRTDTVVIEPSQLRVTVKGRLSFVTRRGGPPLREIVFGHVTPAFLLARRKGKDYLSTSRGDGTISGMPAWRP